MSDGHYTRRDWIRFAVIVLLLGASVGSSVASRISARDSARAARSSEASAEGVKALLQDRIKETDRRRLADEQAAAAKAEQDKKDADLLAALKKTADTNAKILAAVESCTTPSGECSRQGAQRTAAAIQELRAQHDEQLRQIRALEFRVSGTVDGGVFQGTARPVEGQECRDAIGVGNVGVLPGVACLKPQP